MIEKDFRRDTEGVIDYNEFKNNYISINGDILHMLFCEND